MYVYSIIIVFPKKKNVLAAGTKRERGLLTWNSHLSSSEEKDEHVAQCYEIPLVMGIIRR